MSEQSQPLTYRLIGHVARDLTPEGPRLGGTVAYAGLTAAALGTGVGIVTACASDVELRPFAGIDLITIPSAESTAFRNRETPSGRTQTIVSRARNLRLDMIPSIWRSADVIHLAPIADELELDRLGELPSQSLFITAQGWLRRWDENGVVQYKSWRDIRDALALSRAVVCSLEDLDNDPHEAKAMAQIVPMLVVTRGKHGAWLFETGSRTEIKAKQVEEVDPTGAGDIFAAVFFAEVAAGSEPREAALRANDLAGRSVTRSLLESIPTQDEIEVARGGN